MAIFPISDVNSSGLEPFAPPSGSRLPKETLERFLSRLFLKEAKPGLTQILPPKIEDLRHPWTSVDTSSLAFLRDRLGTQGLAQLTSLCQERDSERFAKGLFRLSRGWGEGGKGDLAVLLLGTALQVVEDHSGQPGDVSQSLKGEMSQAYHAMQGLGPFGRQFPYRLAHFVEGVADPVSLTAFGFGAGAYSLARYGMLSRALISPARHSLTELLVKRLAAFSAGVAAESAALNLSQRGLSLLLGRTQETGGMGFGKSLLATGITLGFLRGAGVMTRGALLGLYGNTAQSLMLRPVSQGWLEKTSRLVFPQTAMLGALLLAHHTEAKLGLLGNVRGEDALTSSLFTLVQFQVAGQWYLRLQPKIFGAMLSHVDGKLEKLWQGALRKTQKTWADGVDAEIGVGEGARLAFPEGNPWIGKGEIVTEASGHRGWRDNIWLSEKKEGPISDSLPPAMRISSRIRTRPDYFEKVKLLEEAPFPVLITRADGEILYGNQLASKIFRNNGTPLMGRSLGDLLKKEPQYPGYFKPKQGKYREKIFELEVQKHSDENEFEIYYLKDVTELQTLKESHQHLAAKASLMEALENILHDSNNWMLSLMIYKDAVHPHLVELYRAFGQSLFPTQTFERDVKTERIFSASVDALTELLRTGRGLVVGAKIPGSRFNLQDLLSSAASFQESLRKKHAVHLNIAVDPKLEIFGNKTLLTSSFVHLIRNAYQAMPEGGRLQISAVERGGGTDIVFKDSGMGIPSPLLSRVFEPGFTSRQEGHGLGLYLVRRVVETLHSGTLKVESQPGKGATFVMYLPMTPGR